MKYLRKKGRWKNGESKYIIEENSKYIRTVPMVEKLLELIREDSLPTKPSQEQPDSVEKEQHKFTQPSLSEPSEDDINKTLLEMTK